MMLGWCDDMQWFACSRDKIYKMVSVGDFLKQYYQSDTIYKIIAKHPDCTFDLLVVGGSTARYMYGVSAYHFLYIAKSGIDME